MPTAAAANNKGRELREDELLELCEVEEVDNQRREDFNWLCARRIEGDSRCAAKRWACRLAAMA